MITRVINSIEFDINEYESNEIYLNENDYIKTNNGDLDSILEMFWGKKHIFLPLSMTWELTDNCNFECPFCYIHDKNRSDKYEWKYRFKNMKAIIDFLIEKGLFICYLTGGECLTHPDFVKIYKYLKKRGVLVVILTNASLLYAEHFKLFSEYKPYKIEVSIYDTKYTYSKESVKDASNVLSNVVMLKEKGINVVAKMPINFWTKGSFDRVRYWTEKNKIPFYFSNELFDKYDGTDLSKYKIYEKDKEKREIGKKSFGYKKAFDCVAGKYSFLLTYDGFLCPCFMCYGISDCSFSIFDTNFFDAYSDLKKYIMNSIGNKLPYCNGCEEVDLCQECIATQLKITNVKKYVNEVWLK